MSISQNPCISVTSYFRNCCFKSHRYVQCLHTCPCNCGPLGCELTFLWDSIGFASAAVRAHSLSDPTSPRLLSAVTNQSPANHSSLQEALNYTASKAITQALIKHACKKAKEILRHTNPVTDLARKPPQKHNRKKPLTIP